MRNRRDTRSPGNREGACQAFESFEREEANLELLASVASTSAIGHDPLFTQVTRRVRSGKRQPTTRKTEFMRSGGCLDDGDTTASDEHVTFVVADQKNTAESEDPVQDRRKRLKPCNARHAPAHSNIRSATGPRVDPCSHGARQSKVSSDGFASFATKYRDVLKFANADEAEAVYSMVTLTQSHHDAWAEGQGTTAPHIQQLQGEGLPGGGQVAGGQAQDPAMADASTPAASHTEGVASDTSTKSAPGSKSQGGKGLADHPVQQPTLRPIMPGMMLAPMPMPVRASGGAAPNGMSVPMVPPPFPFPGTIMAMAGMGPSMATFMPPWAYPPMFGAMPMPMIGPNGQALVPTATGPQGMLMPIPPGAPLPPGMMLGMPPYMAAAMQPVGSTGMGSPVMGIGMPLTSMPPASLGPLAMPPAAGTVASAEMVATAAPAAAMPVSGPAMPVAPTAVAATSAAPSTAAPAGGSGVPVNVTASTAPAGKAALQTMQQAGMLASGPGTMVMGHVLAGGNTSAAAHSGLAVAAEKVTPVPELLPGGGEASRRCPAESSQSSQQQLCLENSSPQQGDRTHSSCAGGPAAAATTVPLAAVAAAGCKAEVVASAGEMLLPLASVKEVVVGDKMVHSAIEQLNVGELKSWVLAHFGEDVYLMLLDVWRPDSPKVRDAIWAWRSHVQQPRPDGAEPDYRAFLVSLFGLEKLLQVSAAAQQKGVPCTCSCAAHDGAARLKLAAAAVASMQPLVPSPQVAPVDG